MPPKKASGPKAPLPESVPLPVSPVPVSTEQGPPEEHGVEGSDVLGEHEVIVIVQDENVLNSDNGKNPQNEQETLENVEVNSQIAEHSENAERIVRQIENRDTSEVDEHERVHQAINDYLSTRVGTIPTNDIAFPPPEGNVGQQGNEQNARAHRTHFAMPPPSAEEAQWIANYFLDRNMQDVSDEDIKKVLSAIRNTVQLNPAAMPRPSDKITEGGAHQVVLTTASPELTQQHNRSQASEGPTEGHSAPSLARRDENKFHKLRNLMADLHMDSATVMNLLLDNVGTPSREGSRQGDQIQTVIRNQPAQTPMLLQLTESPVTRQAAPDAARRKLTFAEQLELQGRLLEERRLQGTPSPEVRQRERSNLRMQLFHEVESLQIQIDYGNKTKGAAEPALVKRRDELVKELFPQQEQADNVNVQGGDQTNPTQAQQEVEQQDISSTLIQQQPTALPQHQNLVLPAQLPTQHNQPRGHWPGRQGGLNNHPRSWYGQTHAWGLPRHTSLPQLSLDSATLGDSASAYHQPQQALAIPGNQPQWQQIPSATAPHLGMLASGAGGGLPPSQPNLQEMSNMLALPTQQLQPMNQNTEMMIISKMKLPTYRGRTDRRTPYEYIRQVRVAAETSGISLQSMLQRKIPMLMVEEAANWFAVNCKYFSSWEIFHRLFMEEYSCPNYYQQLLRDLELRRQDPAESVTVFLHKTILLCREIDPTTPDWFIIEKATRNMHPDFRSRVYPLLATNPTLAQFEHMLRQVQNDLYDTKNYKPPPPAHEFAEPAFAYDDNKVHFNVSFSNKNQTQQPQSSSESIQSQPNKSSVSMTMAALNPQITRQRAREAKPRSNSADRQSGGYNKGNYQQSSNQDRSRSPFKNQGSNNKPQGYSPGGRSWSSPGGSRWARTNSPSTSNNEGSSNNKLAQYKSPSRPADQQRRENSPSRSSHQGGTNQPPPRPNSPSRFQAKAANAEESKN